MEIPLGWEVQLLTVEVKQTIRYNLRHRDPDSKSPGLFYFSARLVFEFYNFFYESPLFCFFRTRLYYILKLFILKISCGTVSIICQIFTPFHVY